jgi:hypothetical protein
MRNLEANEEKFRGEGDPFIIERDVSGRHWTHRISVFERHESRGKREDLKE